MRRSRLLAILALLSAANLAVLVVRLVSLYRGALWLQMPNAEPMNVYALWKLLNGYPLYESTGRPFLPFTPYNFLFYYSYGAAMRLFGVTGSGVSFWARMPTLASACVGASILYRASVRLSDRLNVTPERGIIALLAEAEAPPSAPAPVQGPSAPIRTRLNELRTRLLALHKTLLDDAKVAYELDRGRIASVGVLLQLVISDPWFAWLHQLSELVVRIDEMTAPDSTAADADARALFEQVDRLLVPSESGDPFARRYDEAMQRQPAVVLAHGDVKRLLKTFQ